MGEHRETPSFLDRIQMERYESEAELRLDYWTAAIQGARDEICNAEESGKMDGNVAATLRFMLSDYGLDGMLYRFHNQDASSVAAPDLLSALRQLAEIRPDLFVSRFDQTTTTAYAIYSEASGLQNGFVFNSDTNGSHTSLPDQGAVHLWLLALARAEAFYPHMVSNHFKGGQWYVKLYGDVTHRSCLLKGEGYDADPTTALALALVEALRTDP